MQLTLVLHMMMKKIELHKISEVSEVTVVTEVSEVSGSILLLSY